MRIIFNFAVILPYYLAHVRGLVIPRDELDGLGIVPCTGLDTCVEVADTPSLDKLDGSSLSDNGVPVSNFITDYTDSLGEVHPLVFNPTSINEGLFDQLKEPDPLILNEPLVDQLRQQLPPLDNSQSLPSTESFDPSGDQNFFTQAKTIPSPIDLTWHDDPNIFSW